MMKKILRILVVQQKKYELREFKRIELEAKEEQLVCFELNARIFSYSDAENKNWHTPTGNYVIYIGQSSLIEDAISVEWLVPDCRYKE